MRIFSFLMATLGIVVYLVANYSFWQVFGGLYAAGMIVVVAIAYNGRRRDVPQSALHDMHKLKNDD